MKLLILRSRRRPADTDPEPPYTQRFDTRYAERVIGNLRSDEDFCGACGPDCNACRRAYGRRLGPDIAGVLDLPAILPYLLEDPERLVPDEVPPHDVLLAVNVHEQVLLEFLRRAGQWGTRGVVVPLEAPDRLSGSGQARGREICDALDIEAAFPKPFCAFDPPAGSLLAAFRERFHVGKPAVELRVAAGRIAAAHVAVSAACGATYFVARWLIGRAVGDDLRHDVVSRCMHSYPCTASMKWDDELGDTALHVATRAHYEVLAPLERPQSSRGEPAMVRSPLGTMVPAPVPPRRNVEKIHAARAAILEDLAARGETSLADLRRRPTLTSAALVTALLMLRQEGKVRTEGPRIRPA